MDGRVHGWTWGPIRDLKIDNLILQPFFEAGYRVAQFTSRFEAGVHGAEDIQPGKSVAEEGSDMRREAGEGIVVALSRGS